MRAYLMLRTKLFSWRRTVRARFTSADLRQEAWTADAGSRCSNRLFLCSGSAAATATCCAAGRRHA